MTLFNPFMQPIPSEAASFMNGVNYGNIFIPEDFFADNDFYSKYNIPKNAD